MIFEGDAAASNHRRGLSCHGFQPVFPYGTIYGTPNGTPTGTSTELLDFSNASSLCAAHNDSLAAINLPPCSLEEPSDDGDYELFAATQSSVAMEFDQQSRCEICSAESVIFVMIYSFISKDGPLIHLSRYLPAASPPYRKSN